MLVVSKKRNENAQPNNEDVGWMNFFCVSEARASVLSVGAFFFWFFPWWFDAKKHEEHKIGTYVVRLS